ncbi:MAG: CPBP family glutamic-type intramembrane protease [Bacilli bacterium]|nr:CPBP family glutamic-type intramembrane protease [Bacilli bacterium]MDD4407319.1 CPBP family glutamic-type intramembrane protease [Bacilli bacterium]
MNNYKKYILTLLIFFIIPLVINSLLPSIGSNNIIDLILRLTISSLILLTFIYLFYFEIVNDLKYIKNNKKKVIMNIILYLFILIIAFIITKISVFLINQNSGDTILKIDFLYKKIPFYLFINNIILMPLIETIVFRHIFYKFIKNNILFLIISLVFLSIYYNYILNISDLYFIITGFILSLSYIKNKNIITITIINMIFNLLIFLLNYL